MPDAPASPPAPDQDDQQDARPPWGWLDTAGIIAGGVLLLILADVWTDGRVLSRWLRRGQPGQQQPEPEPAAAPSGD